MPLPTNRVNVNQSESANPIAAQDTQVVEDFLQIHRFARLPDVPGASGLNEFDAKQLGSKLATFGYKFHPLDSSDLVELSIDLTKEFREQRLLRYGRNYRDTNSTVLDQVEARTGTKFGYHMTNGLSLAILSSLGWVLPDGQENSKGSRVAAGMFMMAFSAGSCLGYSDGGARVVRIMREIGLPVSEGMEMLAQHDVLLCVDLSVYRAQSVLSVVDLSRTGIITPCPPPLAFAKPVVTFIAKR